MGENLALNMENKGFTVSLFDASHEKVQRFVDGRGRNKNIRASTSLQALVETLELPRKVLLMVPAGRAVDDVLAMLVTLLKPGDIVIDGGNSHFSDTNRRVLALEAKGLHFVGAGVSGGEEGALHGPAIMPGGSFAAWNGVQPIFQAIAAKVDDGVPCCAWIGDAGSGHFVKMVHNGIEYGDMQLICEVYDIMRRMLRMTASEMHAVFAQWNEGPLKSYLIEITRDILAVQDDDGAPLLDKILDKAGQKGTGKWTVASALDLGVPLTLITESVFARTLSSMKDERMSAAQVLSGPTLQFSGDRETLLADLGNALYAAKIISYTQGYQLMRSAALDFGWHLNFGAIALIWRGGCIIRSAFLGRIKAAFDADPELVNLLLDPFFRESMAHSQQPLRNVLVHSLRAGVPVPAMSAALAYYDGLRSESLPANLLQAQRDYFGAHQYERIDRPRGEFFHTNWTGRGGDTASTVYSG